MLELLVILAGLILLVIAPWLVIGIAVVACLGVLYSRTLGSW